MRDKARRIVLILGLVLVLVGAGVLLYPRFTAFRYAQEVSRQKESFLEQVDPEGTHGEEAQEPDPRLEELYEKLTEENQRLYEEHQYLLSYRRGEHQLCVGRAPGVFPGPHVPQHSEAGAGGRGAGPEFPGDSAV